MAGMALPHASIPELLQWLGVVADLLVVLGGIAAVCWAPFLLSTRMRALVRRLPPFESVFVTYVGVTVGASVPYVLGLVGALAVADTGKALFTVTLAVSLVYLIAGPLLGAVVIPQAGIDWNPTGYGLSTWVVLLAGALWYVLLFAVPFTVLSVVFSLP